MNSAKKKFMQTTTLDVIKAALKGDQTVRAADRSRLLGLLRNDGEAPGEKASAERIARIVRRAEAARRLGCSLRLVDRLARDGILPKRRLPNRQRAAGFLESDLDALIAGKLL